MAFKMALVEKHDVHKYKRVKLGTKGYEVYKCMKTNCPHYIRKELVVGKLTECWRCGRPVQMTEPMAKQAKPHCRGCTREYIRHTPPSQNPEEAA